MKRIITYFGKKILNHISSGIVLMYHRICDEDFDPYAACVSTENFVEHLRILKENFELIPLEFLPETIKNLSVGKKFVVITFDDGYKDSLKAFEILDMEKVPATLFVITGHLLLDQNQRKEDMLKKILWWDRLKDLILRDFKELYIKNGDKELVFVVEEEGGLGEFKIQVTAPLKSLASGKYKMSKSELFSYLYLELKYKRESERENILSLIEEQVGGWRIKDDPLVSEDDIRAVASLGFSIGAHTETHQVLSILSVDEQRNEIEMSRRKLQEILKSDVKEFSYPFGLSEDLSHKTIELVKNSGFEVACTGVKRVVFPFICNRYAIPRFPVMNWNGRVFEQKLKAFFRMIG